MCQHSSGDVAGWRVINPHAGAPKSGTIYRLVGDAVPEGFRLSPAEEALKRKEDEDAKAKEIKKARDFWNCAVEDSPDVAAYIEARWVRVADLPGGVVPETIRGTPDRSDRLSLADDKNIWVATNKGPVLVAKAVNAAGRGVAVQRIFLEPGGRSKRATPRNPDGSRLDGDEGGGINTKLGLGPLTGCAVRLLHGYPGATLHLCEGVETGWGILAALKEAVWACVSTSGLKNLELPADDVGVVDGIRRIVIWGDWDELKPNGERPGPRAAEMAQKRLRGLWPRLPVEVVLPGHARFPEMIGADGGILV